MASTDPAGAGHPLELIERAAHDPELLAQLSPSELAATTDPDARDRYLRGLLEDLPEELIERSITDSRQ